MQWNAKWIWQEEDGPANTWMCFRKKINISVIDKEVIAKIAVDSKYWLWINNELVVFEGGLKRGPNPQDTYYDEINIKKYIYEGDNTIALLVWYWGKDGFSHNDSGKGGLLFQCELGTTKVHSDISWKVLANPAYMVDSSCEQPNYRLPEHNVIFDARNTIAGWMRTDYDDSFWMHAVEKGIPPIEPWSHLWKRSIPQWKDFGLKDYVNSNEIITSMEGTVVAKLPYNAQITPYIKLEAPAGLTIDMRTENYFVYDVPSVRAEYITKNGIQEYESLGWMNGHEVHYKIPKGVKILELKYRETGYDTELVGEYKCNDIFLNQLWKKCVRTLYVTMRDSYMDCPDRERAQWWGDVVIELGKTFYTFDSKSHELVKKAIFDLVGWQRTDGSMYSPVPQGNWNGELPLQILASISTFGFWTYYMYTGDEDTIKKIYPNVKKYLKLWKLDDDGLILHRAGDWDWADWGENIDVRILDNTWYYLALDGAEKMAILSGNISDLEEYEKNKKSIVNNFNRVFWQGNCYRSPDYKGITDDRANSMAIICGFAEKSKWEDIQLVLNTYYNASPYMEKYVLESLFMMGLENDAFTRIKKRYKEMVDDTNCTTLYELWTTKGGSLNHAWTGGPLTLLYKYVVGIAPEEAGFEKYHVFPQEGELNNINATVPTLYGNIHVFIQKNSKSYKLNLESPKNTQGIIGIPIKRMGFSKYSILINGICVVKDGKKQKNIIGMQIVGINDGYFIFMVDSGNWNFWFSGEEK